MTQRYVRVQTDDGLAHYGLLCLNHEVEVLDAPPWQAGKPTALTLPPEGYHLLAPCAPSKIVAVGKNYAQHAAEMGTPVPAEPLLFLKPSTTIVPPEQPILYPHQSQHIEYEGELALVIGESCCDCSPAEAASKIWGYTIANDVTARDLQRQEPQWTRAKGFDSFCPLGPWVVRELNTTAQLQTFVNNDPQPRQSASIAQMVFAPETLVAYISQVMTLLPGDVVLTGTPAGVAPLQVGDRVRIEIEGIGVLENPVARRSAPTELAS
jgi:2-keto-4-pentenoate hydratase/2-oxohepta-3-ene-1,7-dioic acid hydratase in catechol pathway